MKRIVLFVEGHGDEAGVLVLAKRMLSEMGAFTHLLLDPKPFRVKGVEHLVAKSCSNWKRMLESALRRNEVGGVLVVLDGDATTVDKQPFCAWRVAAKLADVSRDLGAGAKFSVAVVFARQEFESWFIAGVESLAGKTFASGVKGVKQGTVPPTSNLEETPRGAKEWLSRVMEEAYNPVRHQGEFAKIVEFALIRTRPMRSFLRFESALAQLHAGIRDERHLVTPTMPTE